MRIVRVLEIPHGGDVYVDRESGEEPVLWLLATHSEAVAERLARMLEQPDL
jgi:hypothetical protein